MLSQACLRCPSGKRAHMHLVRERRRQSSKLALHLLADSWPNGVELVHANPTERIKKKEKKAQAGKDSLNLSP